MAERLYTEQEVAELVSSIRDAVVGSERAAPSDSFARDTRTQFAFMEGVRFRYRTRTDAIARALSAWRERYPQPAPEPSLPLMFEDVGGADIEPDEPMMFGVEDGP